MTYYHVRFTCYQYNSGRADNGFYPVRKKFNDRPAAEAFAAIIKEQVKLKEREFGSQFVWDGYVERFDGIFEITERRL
jgi:hypothetical protein